MKYAFISETNDHDPMALEFILTRARRLFRIRILAFASLTGIGLIAVFYAEENWRGNRAWTKYVREKTAQGLYADWASIIPAPVPDAENFAMTRSLAALYDFQPGTQIARSTKTSGKLAQILRDIESARLDIWNGNWMRGWHSSLSGCLTNQVMKQTPRKLSKEGADIINYYATLNGKEQAQEILQLLEPLHPLWKELREAANRPYCRYPAKYEFTSYEISTPHLKFINDLCPLLRLAAICRLELGDAEAALADLELGFFLSNTLRADPWSSSYDVRCACDHLLTQAIWEGTSRHLWSANQLERLQKLRIPKNEIPEARRTLLSLLIEGIDVIDGQRNFFKTDWNTLWHSKFASPEFVFPLYCRFAPKGWFAWEKYNLSRRYDEFVPRVFDLQSGRISTNDFSRIQAWWDSPIQNHPVRHHIFFTRMFDPQLEQMAKRVAKEQTTVDLAYLGCALERFWQDKHEWPARLTDLLPAYIEKMPVDLLSGVPYRYRLIDKDHFVLYSTGIDGKDDGGTAHYDPQRKNTADTGDWIWLGGN